VKVSAIAMWQQKTGCGGDAWSSLLLVTGHLDDENDSRKTTV